MEQRVIKRVAAIHDLSGFGRASLTAIIPTCPAWGSRSVPCPPLSYPTTPAASIITALWT